MKTLFLLTFMQLKDYLSISKSVKDNILKLIGYIAKFVILTAIFYLAFYVITYYRWVSYDGIIPVELITVIFGLLLCFSIITCTIKIMNNMYFGNDNSFLLTLPSSKIQLYISKLLLMFISEIIKNIYFILPLFVGYGLINKYSIGFYFWLIPCLILFTLLIVSISGLLSIPAMQLSIFLKRNLVIKTALVIFLLSFLTYVIIKVINILPQNLNFVMTWGETYWKIQDFLTYCREKFTIFAILTEIFVGDINRGYIEIFTVNTIKYLMSLIGVIVVVLILSIVFIRPIFFKMASIPFEYKKTENVKPKKNLQLNPFMSTLKKEILLIMRTPEKLTPLLIMAVVTPVSVLLMNKIYSAFKVKDIGVYMIISFNIMITMLLAMSTNSSLAKCLSEEGVRFYQTKLTPNKFIVALLPKIIFNILVMTLSIIVSVVILTINIKMTVLDGIFVFMIIEIMYVAHALWSAEIDIMNPQYNQYSVTMNILSNPNETKSIVISFILAIIIAVYTYLNLNEFTKDFSYIGTFLKITLIASIFLAFRIYMYKNQIELYYKEK